MSLRQNYRFSEKTKLGDSVIHGKGRFATLPIERGEVVIEAGGRVISLEEFNKTKEDSVSYLLMPGAKVLVTKCQERFNVSSVNHSCDPNMVFEFPFWTANRNIQPGEELTTDYSELGYESSDDLLPQQCNCQSDQCRKKV